MTNVKGWVCLTCSPSSVPCPHLEALLPSMEQGKIRLGGVDASTTTTNFFRTVFWSFDHGPFLELMRNYGFTDEWDLELLEAKFCRNLSAADVAKEQNYVSKDKVKRRLKQLRALLKERGFEQEHWKWEPKK